jgi:hypothetical protein
MRRLKTHTSLSKNKKSGDSKGLPTVSSVMEELKKDNPGGIANGEVLFLMLSR